jgi:hypothetical protein
VHCALHQQTGAGDAALPGTAEYRCLGAEQGARQVSVSEHDVARLAAELQHARHDVARGGGCDLGARLRRADEHHEARVTMPDGGCTRGWTSAGQHRHQTARHSLGTVAQLTERER